MCVNANTNEKGAEENGNCDGVTTSIGFGRYLGMSSSKNKVCINIGPSVGLPVSFSAPTIQ